MGLFDFLTPNVESRGVTQIGKVEVAKEGMVDMLTGLMNSMGLVNPGAVTNTSSKAVTITKKGNTYVITLNLYNPPITFTWTGLLPSEKLAEVIFKLIDEKKRINYINKVKTSDGDFVQVGIS